MLAASKTPSASYSLLPGGSADSEHHAQIEKRSTPRRRILLLVPLVSLIGILYLSLFRSSEDLRSSAEQAWSCAANSILAPAITDNGLLSSYPLSPLSNEVVVLIKTGHSVAHSRMPSHLQSPRPDMPNRLIYSDYPMTYAGADFIDIIANITQKNYDQVDMQYYRDLHDAVDNGVPPEDLPSFHLWQLDKYKFVPMHAHAYRAYPNAKWQIAMDGDSFIFYQNLLRWLEQFDHTQPYFFGERQEGNDRVWAQGGSGYVVSQGVMNKTVALDPWGWEHKQDHILNSERGGDVVIARILKETEGLNITEPDPRSKGLFIGEPIASLSYSSETWLAPIMSLHHLKPSQVLELRRFEQSVLPTLEPGDYIRHCDLFRHFAPKAIAEELTAIFKGSAWGRPTYRRKAWRAAEPGSVVFTWEWAKLKNLEYNADFCDLLCGEREDCMSWNFENHALEKERRCVLMSNAFGFGKPDTTLFTNADEKEELKVECGWRLDRIREIEKTQGCGDRARRRMSDRKNGW